MTSIEPFLFKDDGRIPNSRLPLFLYRNVLPAGELSPAVWFEQCFTRNNWLGTWRNGILDYHHYHSTSHEVLGIYGGSVTMQLGGENGTTLTASVGDVLVIPAGVGHRNVGQTSDLGVVGAYPDGRVWDLLRGEPGERPQADQNIAQVPLPATDPVYGKSGPIPMFWRMK